MVGISESLSAIISYRKAEELLKRLRSDLLSETLNEVLTIKIIENTLKDAKQLIHTDKYDQASVLIDYYILGGVEELEEKTDELPTAFSERIELFKRTISQTRYFADAAELSSFEVEGRIEYSLTSLCGEGQQKLVGKLLDDLNFVLAARIDFYRHWTNCTSTVDKSHPPLIEALRSGGWTSGINYLLRHRYGDFQARIPAIEKRLIYAQTQQNT